VFFSLIAMTGLITLAVIVHGTYDGSAARSAWLGWTLLILAMACVGSGLAHAINQYDHWEGERWARYGNVVPRFQLGITEREWQVLQLIAHDDTTYRQIADQLHLSPETIKTHVRHLGEKLDTSGRHKVVAAARQHGLLPDTLETEESHNSA
jgi:DNA-binding CsgD family transcriptional regulator